MKILLYHTIIRKPKQISYTCLVRRKKCCYSGKLTHYLQKSWDPANPIESPWLLLEKQYCISGLQVSKSQHSVCAPHCSWFVLPLSYSRETGIHCCSIILATEMLCRLHYFRKFKHKVLWIKIGSNIFYTFLHKINWKFLCHHISWFQNLTINHSFLSYAFPL